MRGRPRFLEQQQRKYISFLPRKVLTSSKFADILNARYAAVLVVFISSDFGDSS